MRNFIGFIFLLLLSLKSDAYLTPIGYGSSTGTGAQVLATSPTISNLTLTGTTNIGATVMSGAMTMSPLGTANSGANFASNAFNLYSSYWNGSAAAQDAWVWQSVLGTGTNPYSIMNLAHTGTPGLQTVYMPALDNTPIGLINPSPAGFSTATITTLLTLPVQGVGVAPSSPVAGSVALTSVWKLCVYTGAAWKNASDGSTACTF